MSNPNIKDPIKAAYRKGVEEGIRKYAWWKDGAEFVGTCGTSLTTALRNMDEEAGVTCWHPTTHDVDGVEYCLRCGVAQ